MGNSAIKRIANEAKRKLKNGYWEDLYKNREEDLMMAKKKGVSGEIVVDAYRQKLDSVIHTKQDVVPNENELYGKIYDIVCREMCGETVYNPIGILKNVDYYNNLDDYGKQKYIFDLSAVYIKTRLEIERELKIKSLKE